MAMSDATDIANREEAGTENAAGGQAGEAGGAAMRDGAGKASAEETARQRTLGDSL